MSALDDAISQAMWPCGPGDYDYDEELQKKARAELELLREAAFGYASDRVNHYSPYELTSKVHVHCVDARARLGQRILRTDPERAKRMGLGWAL